MTTDARIKLLDEIEREHAIFLNKLSGLDDGSFDINIEDIRSPKEILEEQIDLFTECVSQKESFRIKGDVTYSYQELKYIFSLMYINLLSWVENLSEDSKIIEEFESGNGDTINEWFDKFLLSKMRANNKDLEIWVIKYCKNKL